MVNGVTFIVLAYCDTRRYRVKFCMHMTTELFLKWGGCLFFSKFEIVTAATVQMDRMSYHLKCLGDRSNIWRLFDFQNGSSRTPSWIFQMRTFYGRYGSEMLYASICQILWWSVKPLPIYVDLSIFQYGGRQPS